MTKAEILMASQKELQARWVEIMSDPDTWKPEPNDRRREWLLIGIRLSLLRGETKDAAELAEVLKKMYGESLKEDE